MFWKHVPHPGDKMSLAGWALNQQPCMSKTVTRWDKTGGTVEAAAGVQAGQRLLVEGREEAWVRAMGAR